MDLILWRHADAHDPNDHQLDIERTLSAKGHKQAMKMAHWLSQVMPKNCRILVSPAERTLQTVAALALPFEINDIIYTAREATEILSIASWPHHPHAVLIVGHQPLLGEMVSHIIPSMHPVAIQKGSVWWLSPKSHGTTSSAFLKAVMTPDLINLS